MRLSTPHLPSLVSSVALLAASPLFAQLGPEVTSWRTNLNGASGYSTDATIHASVSTVAADVRAVQYDSTDVYVSCTTVPSYDVGPFRGNPGVPGDTQSVFRITRTPTVAANKSANGLGPIVVFLNGVPGYNASDGRSYFNLGIWNQNAMVVEGPGLDSSLGHPSPGRGGADMYHHHCLSPAQLEQEGETWGREHSPLVGFSFDGFPIYGPFGYVNANGTGGIKRMESGWTPRNITVRQTRRDGTPLQPSEYGPVVSAQYPLGFFIEDFAFTNTGDLDEHNGRFTVTPEYPNGTYAYFTTVDANLEPAYPFIIGPEYYGVLVDNRRVVIPPGVTTYSEQTQRTGASCTGLELDAVGLPVVPSSTFAIQLTSGPAHAASFYLFSSGLLPIPDSVAGCAVYLDLTSQVTISLAQQLDSSGANTLGLVIPNDPTLVDVSLDIQAVASDGTVVTTSNALTLLLQ